VRKQKRQAHHLVESLQQMILNLLEEEDSSRGKIGQIAPKYASAALLRRRQYRRLSEHGVPKSYSGPTAHIISLIVVHTT
jgi:hypothetical protein